MVEIQRPDNGESQNSKIAYGFHHHDLMDMRQKTFLELKACMNQVGRRPGTAFVAVYAKRNTKAKGNGLRTRTIQLAFMDSEDFFTLVGQVQRLDQFTEAYNIETNTVTAVESIYSAALTTPDGDHALNDDSDETFTQALQKYKDSHPIDNLILVGYGLQPIIEIMQRYFPDSASLFSDAIDTAWPIWSSVPYDKKSASKNPILRALGYTPETTKSRPHRQNNAVKSLALLERLYHITARQASLIGIGTMRVEGTPVPRLYVARDPKEPHVAKIYPIGGVGLPDEIDSTVKLASFIAGLGHSAVKVGTWDARSQPPFNTRLDIRETGRCMAWACFADRASLKNFVRHARGSDIGGKVVITTSGTPDPVSLREIQMQALEEQRRREEREEESRRWREEYLGVQMDIGPLLENMTLL